MVPEIPSREVSVFRSGFFFVILLLLFTFSKGLARATDFNFGHECLPKTTDSATPEGNRPSFGTAGMEMRSEEGRTGERRTHTQKRANSGGPPRRAAVEGCGGIQYLLSVCAERERNAIWSHLSDSSTSTGYNSKSRGL